MIGPRSFPYGCNGCEGPTRPSWERANAYPSAENYLDSPKYGVVESFDCQPAGGERSQPEPDNSAPPCHVAPANGWDHKQFPQLLRGYAPNSKAPDDPGRAEAANPNHYSR